MRIPPFLVQPAVIASLAIHGSLALVAPHSGGPMATARAIERTTQTSIDFEPLDAEVPAEAVEAPRPAPPLDAPTPAPDHVDLLTQREVLELDPTPVDVPELPPDEPIVASAPSAAPIAPALTRSTISVRLRPRRNAPSTPVWSAPAPTVDAAAPGERARVVTPPGRLATNRAPDYPYEARAAGYEGVAVLRVEIRADGSVAAVQLRSSSGHASLDRAAEEAVRGWGFTPPRVDGSAVPMTVDVPVTFRLR
jgi:periplasmic protein TonB